MARSNPVAMRTTMNKNLDSHGPLGLAMTGSGLQTLLSPFLPVAWVGETAQPVKLDIQNASGRVCSGYPSTSPQAASKVWQDMVVWCFLLPATGLLRQLCVSSQKRRLSSLREGRRPTRQSDAVHITSSHPTDACLVC